MGARETKNATVLGFGAVSRPFSSPYIYPAQPGITVASTLHRRQLAGASFAPARPETRESTESQSSARAGTMPPLEIHSLRHARQLLSAGRRRRVVSVSGAESLAEVPALGRLLYRARRRILPKRRRWEVLGYRRILNLGSISGTLASLRRRDLPRLYDRPFDQARIQRVRQRAQRVRALSSRVGGGAPGYRSLVLADRLLLLADDADRLRLIADDADARLLAVGS